MIKGADSCISLENKLSSILSDRNTLIQLNLLPNWIGFRARHKQPERIAECRRNSFNVKEFPFSSDLHLSALVNIKSDLNDNIRLSTFVLDEKVYCKGNVMLTR